MHLLYPVPRPHHAAHRRNKYSQDSSVDTLCTRSKYLPSMVRFAIIRLKFQRTRLLKCPTVMRPMSKFFEITAHLQISSFKVLETPARRILSFSLFVFALINNRISSFLFYFLYVLFV